MRSLTGLGLWLAGFVLAAGVLAGTPARADFFDDFESYSPGPVPEYPPPPVPRGQIGPWIVLDLQQVMTGGAVHPFTTAIDNLCTMNNQGLLGLFVPPRAPGADVIGVAMYTGEVFNNTSVRMKIRYTCHPAISCDPWEGVCRVDTQQQNSLINMRNRFLITGSYDSYWVELHDDGALEIGKAIHIEGTSTLGTPRVNEGARIPLNPARDVWLRAEVQTLADGSVRIRGRAWQNNPQTPGDGTEDEPVIWHVTGLDTPGPNPDPWEVAENVPATEYNPYVLPGMVAIGWDGDFSSSTQDPFVMELSNMTLDDVTITGAVKGPGLAAGDLDGDGDVDVTDFTIFTSCFNGPNNPPACP